MEAEMESESSSLEEMVQAKQLKLLAAFTAKIRKDETNDYATRSKLNRSAYESRKTIFDKLTKETLDKNAKMLFDHYRPYNRMTNAMLRRGMEPTMKQRKTLLTQSVDRILFTHESEWELIEHLVRIGFIIGSSPEDVKFAAVLVEAVMSNYHHNSRDYPALKMIAVIEYIVNVACPPLLSAVELWKKIFYNLSAVSNSKTSESDLALITLLLQRNDEHFFNCCRWLVANCINRMKAEPNTRTQSGHSGRYLSTIEAVFSIVGRNQENLDFALELQRQAYFTKSNDAFTSDLNSKVSNIFKNHPVLGLIDYNERELTPIAVPTLTFLDDEAIVPVELGRLKLLQTWAIFTCFEGSPFDFDAAKLQTLRTTNIFTTICPRTPSPSSIASQSQSLQKGEDNLFTLFLSGADLSGQVGSDKHLPRLQTRKDKLVEHLLPCVFHIPLLVGLVVGYY